MMQKINYQTELEKILKSDEEAGNVPSLFLHSCCAPCSSYVLEYLSQYFKITDFYYNPNITDEREYEKRSRELERLIHDQPHRYPVAFIEGTYEPERFFESVKGLELCREGGERCFRCYELRLRESALRAAEGWTDDDGVHRKYDYFTTTLTISPLKNAQKLNEIGLKLAEEYAVRWLPSDFKKRGGYQRSIELSKEYELYRQNYCGCIFSRKNGGGEA